MAVTLRPPRVLANIGAKSIVPATKEIGGVCECGGMGVCVGGTRWRRYAGMSRAAERCVKESDWCEHHLCLV
jgi:hypothetical protein